MKFAIKLESTRPPVIGPQKSLMFLVFALACAIYAVGGQVIDRVITNVNGHVVLQSDWEDEVAFEAFSNVREPELFTDEERKAALDRLIDQELLRQQVRPTQPVPPDQVAARLAEVRKMHPECSTEDGWRATLQRYGLTQKSLEKHLADELQIMKLVEDRFRPSIQIDQHAVEAYYQDFLLPEMKKTGTAASPLPQVSTRIRELLTERKMNELLASWLANLRAESRILPADQSEGARNR